MLPTRRIWIAAGLVTAAVAAGIGGAIWLVRGGTTPGVDQRLAGARRALALERPVEALALAGEVLEEDSACVEALLVAGEAAARVNRTDDAVGFFDRVPDDESPESLEARFAAADLLLHDLRFSAAEKRFKEVLARDPDHVEANRRLAFLLGAENRIWESLPYLWNLVRNDRFAIVDLHYLALPEEVINQATVVEGARAAVPDDPVPSLGTARMTLMSEHAAEAEPILRQIVAAAPDLVEAQVRLGELLLDRPGAPFLTWHAALPPEAELHPHVWFVRGAWAELAGDAGAAKRCYWKAVLLHPNHQKACYRLAQLLAAEGDAAAAAPFERRNLMLARLAGILRPLEVDKPDAKRMGMAAQQLVELGRLWEAWGWYRAIVGLDPTDEAARAAAQGLRDQLEADPPLTLDSHNPAKQIDLAGLPLPRWDDPPPFDDEPIEQDPLAADGMFADIAGQVGLAFSYVNGDDLEIPGMQIYQELGGGIAALDYDFDFWPDLYCAQGCAWPPNPDQRDHVDALFRNVEGRRVVDVTEAAGLGDERFSQGVAVGDYNQDGFPDLYVGNLGENRLYRNNGDGTFTDVTREAGIAGARWTTSVLMADLNGDGLPDLYDVTYLAGDEPLTRICHDDGKPRACTPAIFEADHDRVWLNQGDGRFEDQSASAGILVSGGKGLGILAADFDGSGRLSLFVANDGTPNFFFLNTTPPGGQLSFEERAGRSGVAVGADGLSQACMGIAAADANGDGRLDLFVTNFYQEPNAFYVQVGPLLFDDQCRATRLRQPSLPMLGFGTQFLDGDLDGLPDLVVANGHVDDFTHRGAPFKMRPQYFHMAGRGRFAEAAPKSLGGYFEDEYLGRALARLDFNGDGREDFAVSHLDAPLALVVNHCQPGGGFLALRLVGVNGSRDAVGATVTATVGGTRRTSQVTAGDGFQASNERQIVFGLGSADVADQVTVRWPSGAIEDYGSLPVNSHFVLIEGSGRPVAFSMPAGAKP